MKINKNKYLIFLFVASLTLGANRVFYPISTSNSIVLGYDSNPLRLSDNEISELDIRPYLLSDAYYVYSRFFNFNSNIKFFSKRTLLSYIFGERKTIFDLGHSYKYYIDHPKKNRSSYSLKIDQQLGDYKHLYIDYFLMPNYYLREYEDLDYFISSQDILNSRHFSTSFDIEKITISYQKLINNSKNKVKFGLFNEKQLFDDKFTEFDLDIFGSSIQFKLYSYNHNYFSNKRTVTFYFETLKANNFTYLDGLYSTSFMDRSYKQKRFKLSFSQIINKNKSFGTTLDTYNRKNTSVLIDDELHYKRKHLDMTLSVWYKKNQHKFMLSNRKRITHSPISWVEDLKTFKRIIFTYTYSLKKNK